MHDVERVVGEQLDEALDHALGAERGDAGARIVLRHGHHGDIASGGTNRSRMDRAHEARSRDPRPNASLHPYAPLSGRTPARQRPALVCQVRSNACFVQKSTRGDNISAYLTHMEGETKCPCRL
ncbi:hypothetical protein AFE02nite_23770 [Actinotalea fermentans]|uniref:Uncharacterized protein n=1 Tax=Actinotalea fermentans TaxID=43671 RepID=A0A511YZP2_9CELL|nr:hypothetical protein AFE02nite_23770 [Actinotalea fermentans]